VTTVTVHGAVGQLSAAVDALWDAVTELTIIVNEDQPCGDGLAVADQLVESVSELQGAVAEARAHLATAGRAAPAPEALATLPLVVGHLQQATTRYWRDVRDHQRVTQLRAATRRRGGEWPGWRHSVESSAARCADPLDSVADALEAGWQELCQLAAMAPRPWQHTSAPDPHRRIP
jgi:hypothetical protein